MILRRGVVAGEEPVLAADGHAFERPLAGVVVDVEIALRHVGGERLPLVLGVGDGSRLQNARTLKPLDENCLRTLRQYTSFATSR